MLTYLKKALKFSADDTDFDDEINQYISSCKADLVRSGVLDSRIVDSDPLILDCVQAFCEFRMAEINEVERRKAIYDSFKADLVISEEYTSEIVG